MMLRRPIALTNARVLAGDALAPSIRFARRVLGIGDEPERGDVVVDVGGAFVLPGLVNAHDHLELNHFGRLKFRERYDNASQWIDDMRPRLSDDPRIRAGRAHPLADRLFAGGLKNVLSGVTTVAHHNPFYRELRFRFPVRVVRRYGWAHSFALAPDVEVVSAYRRTPRGAPFFVHLAEGVDVRAASELARLDGLGCLSERTVLVHGVGLTSSDWRLIRTRKAGIVWCPASNRFLLGRTVPVRELLDRASIGLGTDSRLSGSRDLLEELSEAKAAGGTPQELLAMVTTGAARLLGLETAGRIERGLPADLIVLPKVRDDPASTLVESRRSDLRLVVLGGRPILGAPGLGRVFEARRVGAEVVTLDGSDRLLDGSIAGRIRRSPIREDGLLLPHRVVPYA
jgi:cytosine/adenosine deaminase-related metal-dependent hydrolase